MKTTVLAGALAAALVGAATPLALAQQAASHDPKAVQAGSYAVEPLHTQIGFTLNHLGFTEYSGFFSGASGRLEIDPAKPAGAKLDVTIPVDSVLTTVPKLTEELKGDQWFDATRFPTATFVSTKVTRTGKDTATIAGDFTLHGVTKPITLKARFIGAGVNPLDKAFTLGFSATGTIKRSDYGIKKYVPLLGDDVVLTIAGAFEKEK